MSGTQRVGDYRLLRVIGEGGMGVVHLGLDRSERAVAVKVVRPHVAADPETRARLAREVRSLVKVRHPRVAEVLDADFDAELPYVVMRYVPGEPLDAVVRRDGPLTGPALDEMAVGLFEAVSAIHSVGVVHRDLKPGNVLVLDGSPVVIDFGIARALDDVALTSTGLMVGTPGYLSPEVLDGTDVGTAADWWGWGAVVAYAATGRPPFRSGPMEAVWDRVRRGAVDLEGLPEAWARVLGATLHPDPRARPAPDRLADEVAALTGRRPRLTAPAAPRAAGSSVPPAPTGTTRVQPRPEPARPPRTAVEARPAGPARLAPAPGSAPGRVPPSAPQRARPAAVAAPPTRVVERPAPVAPAPGWTARGSAGPHAGATLAPATPPPGPVDTRLPVQPSSHYGSAPVPPLPRRHLLSLVALVVLVAVAAVAPVGAAVAGLLWVSAARAAQWSRVAAAKARWRTGRLGPGARTGLTLMYPVRLLGAVPASVGHLLVGVLVLSPLLLVGAAVLLRDVPWQSWTVVQAVLTQPPLPTAAVAVGALLAWYGPGGRAVREGSRALTEPVARTRNGRWALLGLAGLVLVAALLVLVGRV